MCARTGDALPPCMHASMHASVAQAEVRGVQLTGGISQMRTAGPRTHRGGVPHPATSVGSGGGGAVASWGRPWSLTSPSLAVAGFPAAPAVALAFPDGVFRNGVFPDGVCWSGEVRPAL